MFVAALAILVHPILLAKVAQVVFEVSTEILDMATEVFPKATGSHFLSSQIRCQEDKV